MQAKASSALAVCAVFLAAAAVAIALVEDNRLRVQAETPESGHQTSESELVPVEAVPESPTPAFSEVEEIEETPEEPSNTEEESQVSLESPKSPVVDVGTPLRVEGGDPNESLVGGAYASVYAKLTVDGILGATNAERYKEDLPLLASNAALAEAARLKAHDILEKQYFAHDSPTGETVADLAAQAGYSYILLGENLAMGNFRSNAALVKAWMDSPGHRANILKEGYTEIGIVAVRGDMKGREVWVAVQEFGRPKSSCPVIPDDVRRAAMERKDVLTLLLRVVDMRKEALDGRESGTTGFAEAAERYNIAARAYNERLADARPLFDTYNAHVRAFNSCVRSVTGS
jgi:uncharacterized protein YkwD